MKLKNKQNTIDQDDSLELNENEESDFRFNANLAESENSDDYTEDEDSSTSSIELNNSKNNNNNIVQDYKKQKLDKSNNDKQIVVFKNEEDDDSGEEDDDEDLNYYKNDESEDEEGNNNSNSKALSYYNEESSEEEEDIEGDIYIEDDLKANLNLLKYYNEEEEEEEEEYEESDDDRNVAGSQNTDEAPLLLESSTSSPNGYDTSPLEEVDNENEKRSVFIQARNNLHISTIPEHLPGREKEKESISKFIESKLINNDSGGCIYIAGIPGTGKTSTVKEVIRHFQQERAKKKVIPFEFIELNGMEFSDPHRIYISLYHKILKRPMKNKITHQHALQLLQRNFTTKSKTRPFRIILVDEFDLLITKKQSVIYNLFEWPNKPHSRMIIIAIANTMNLPDTLLPRVQSRMGLHRIPFSSYTANQIVKIVYSRLEGLEAFDQDAIQICAMRVAAVCGDARRALDICRRATVLAENEYQEKLRQNQNYKEPGKVKVHHIEDVLEQFSTPITKIIKELSFYEKVFLYSIYREQKAFGITDIQFGRIYRRMELFCNVNSIKFPTHQEIEWICARLGSSKLILIEDVLTDFRQLTKLNISLEDLLFALSSDTRFGEYLEQQQN